MPTFAPILQHIKNCDKYSDKSQCLAVILNSFVDKKVKFLPEDKAELAGFVFSEIDKLIELIPTVSTYKEKDEIFAYEDNLLGIVMLCHPSPTDIPAHNMSQIEKLIELVQMERVVEINVDDIFENRNHEKEAVARLIGILQSIEDEYQKGMLYQGLLHYGQQIKELPEDSVALFGDYIASELKRYLDKALDMTVINNMEIACDVAKYFLSDRLIAILYEVLKLGKANINYYAVSTLLSADQTVPTDVIAALASDIEYANLTYCLLKEHGLTECFPAELANEEYLAKSDLIHWLTYPTELGKQPDEIEYLGKIKKKDIYHVFRFRSDSDTLSEEDKGKWMIGWSNENGKTFSNFAQYDAFEDKTPEKTLKKIKKIL